MLMLEDNTYLVGSFHVILREMRNIHNGHGLTQGLIESVK